MTADKAGALGDEAKKWSSIDWKHARRQVRRLQVRIAKAVNAAGHVSPGVQGYGMGIGGDTAGPLHKGCL